MNTVVPRTRIRVGGILCFNLIGIFFFFFLVEIYFSEMVEESED